MVSIKWILDPIFHSCKPNILGVLPVSCHINYFEIRLLSLKDMTFWSFFWPLAICRNNFHDYLLFSVWGWTFLILELTRSLCVWLTPPLYYICSSYKKNFEPHTCTLFIMLPPIVSKKDSEVWTDFWMKNSSLSFHCTKKKKKKKNSVESGIWTHALSDQNLNLAP